MIRPTELPEQTIAYLNSEATRLATSNGREKPELRFVAKAYQEADAQRQGYLPIWIPLYAGLEPKEQTFGLALYFVAKQDQSKQLAAILKACSIVLLLCVAAMLTVRAPYLAFPLVAAAFVLLFAAPVSLLMKGMRAGFKQAIDITGDVDSGVRYVLKREAVASGSDPEDAILNPSRYKNWAFKAFVPPEWRTVI